MLSTAAGSDASSPMMHGDLPPSSSVTGVRFSAAACITSRPTAVEPVKNRWSNGSRENAAPASALPTMVATFSNGNRPARNSARNSAVRGASSEGFTITRLPAASAAISGMIARWNG